MKIFIDDADIVKIKALWQSFPVDGVTTNPTILAKNGRAPYEVLREIRACIGSGAPLQVQVLSRTAEGMVREGHRLAEILGGNTYIKIPAVPEGIKAIRLLTEEGFHVTATAIYSAMQAFLAAKAGAEYAAPYVNRIDNLGMDGVLTAIRIHQIFTVHSLKTQVLAAGFKNTRQVQALCEHGIPAATLAPDILEGLLQNACVTEAAETFITDFEACFGAGSTMLDGV